MYKLLLNFLMWLKLRTNPTSFPLKNIIKIMSPYRDSILVKSWRCLMSSEFFSNSLLSACEIFVCDPFSVLIKWFKLEKFAWKFDWLRSALLSDELYKWLLSWGSGVNVGYIFWWCKPPILPPGDDVVITLEIELNGMPDTDGPKLLKLGTKTRIFFLIVNFSIQ